MAGKTAKKEKDDGQLVLLREILAELRRLNANLEKRGRAMAAEPAEIEDESVAGTKDDEDEDDDCDSEELEYFE